MPPRPTYSTYDAKARFSEILRQVRAGASVTITYRGEEVAEIRPINPCDEALEVWMSRCEDRGLLEKASAPGRRPQTIERRPGALARFLEDRD